MTFGFGHVDAWHGGGGLRGVFREVSGCFARLNACYKWSEARVLHARTCWTIVAPIRQWCWSFSVSICGEYFAAILPSVMLLLRYFYVLYVGYRFRCSLVLLFFSDCIDIRLANDHWSLTDWSLSKVHYKTGMTWSNCARKMDMESSCLVNITLQLLGYWNRCFEWVSNWSR